MTALTDEVRDICAAHGVQTILARPTMDAHAQLRAQLNVIHGELAARGIHSAKIENATYSIETLSRAYMEPTERFDWVGDVHLTKTERRIVGLLHRRMGSTVNHDALWGAVYFDDEDSGEHISDPRKIMQIFICKIRKELTNSAYRIETDFGIGYRMVRTKIPSPVNSALKTLAA